MTRRKDAHAFWTAHDSRILMSILTLEMFRYLVLCGCSCGLPNPIGIVGRGREKGDAHIPDKD